jgi:hypothetical protein
MMCLARLLGGCEPETPERLAEARKLVQRVLEIEPHNELALAVCGNAAKRRGGAAAVSGGEGHDPQLSAVIAMSVASAKTAVEREEDDMRAAMEMSMASANPPAAGGHHVGVSFTDTEGDRSTIELSCGQIEWWAGGKLFEKDIQGLEWNGETLSARQNRSLNARLVEPPPGPERDNMIIELLKMAEQAHNCEFHSTVPMTVHLDVAPDPGFLMREVEQILAKPAFHEAVDRMAAANRGAAAAMSPASADAKTPAAEQEEEGMRAAIELSMASANPPAAMVRAALAAQGGSAGAMPAPIAAQRLPAYNAAWNQPVGPVGETRLQMAANDGHEALVGAMLAKGADPNHGGMLECAPLCVAAMKGHHAVARLLLGGGAGANEANGNGATPLFVAAQQGHTQTVALLLEHGAAVNHVRQNGATALMMAAKNGHGVVVDALLASGAAMDQVTTVGGSCTPLFFAAMNGHVAIARTLLAHGADVDRALAAARASSDARALETLRAARAQLRLELELVSSFATTQALPPGAPAVGAAAASSAAGAIHATSADEHHADDDDSGADAELTAALAMSMQLQQAAPPAALPPVAAAGGDAASDEYAAAAAVEERADEEEKERAEPSWACEACTFVNEDEGAAACAVCGTGRPEAAAAATAADAAAGVEKEEGGAPASGWACEACTFINEDEDAAACAVCASTLARGTRAGSVLLRSRRRAT